MAEPGLELGLCSPPPRPSASLSAVTQLAWTDKGPGEGTIKKGKLLTFMVRRSGELRKDEILMTRSFFTLKKLLRLFSMKEKGNENQNKMKLL